MSRPCRRLLPLTVAVFLLGAATPGRGEPGAPQAPLKTLVVYPSPVELDGPRAEQRLGVLGEYADGRRRDLSREAKFRSEAPATATADPSGVVRPAGDGQTVLTVEAAGRTATVPVRVKGATADTPVSFTREVVPVLTRAGCNAGACHGAQLGRGGFRLSLFGFDPAFDYREIVESAEGRRIVPSAPERSTLLLKPTLSLEHAGGERFPVRSRQYEVLRRWLEDGMPPPAARDPQVTALEVWPARRLLAPGEQQQLLVRATWSDGRTEDVTATARFDSLNDAIASVTPAGLVTARDRGETHVMVRFMGQASVARVTLPYARLDRAPAPGDLSLPHKGGGRDRG